ncbi:hypothetical protein PHYBOEH_005534 [Phytophthora boehmeriae]|uniref:Transmembrane protein n=1 Tax=Phytophthora boehmeriae TaxID=109152 RepID=A0A8T1WLL2_9STRA|nr:hypothetical protein PHYBOEH_005534 [Phytophthora boehmeriae]
MPLSRISTVPMDEAIRTISEEMAHDKDASFVGKTEAEKEVLAKYAAKGRSRALLGALVGSTAMGVLWKFSRNQRKAAGVFAMMSGGLFGGSYGIISIRRDLFSELLLLPSEQSPFAVRARNILLTKIPDNSFVRELNDKLSHSTTFNDSWSEEVSVSKGFSSKSLPRVPPPPPRYNSDVPSTGSIPPITGLDTPRRKQDSNDWQHEEQEAFGEPNDSGRRSPFFFGSKPQSGDEAGAERDIPPLSRDPYERYSRDSHRPESDKSLPPLRHDEDDYFFGVPSDSDEPVKPTTWEEIRRRAAEQRK